MRTATLAARSEINVTPLVDVCLVLLIIFMVVTPLLAPDRTIALPETARPARLGEPPGQLRLTIRADGGVFLDDQPIGDGLLEFLRNAGTDRSLAVFADRSLHYREVRAVLEVASKAGHSEVALVTLKDQDRK